MIGPELVARIRHLSYAEPWKIGRSAPYASELGLHRDTVTRAVRSDPAPKPRPRRRRLTDPYLPYPARDPATGPVAIYRGRSPQATGLAVLRGGGTAGAEAGLLFGAGLADLYTG